MRYIDFLIGFHTLHQQIISYELGRSEYKYSIMSLHFDFFLIQDLGGSEGMAARVVKVLKNGWEMDHIPMKNFERHGDEVLKLFNAKFKTEEERRKR